MKYHFGGTPLWGAPLTDCTFSQNLAYNSVGDDAFFILSHHAATSFMANDQIQNLG
ncbi:N2,N2-dimethylguanosine tRNA methyltransferase [Acetobacter orientalis]|uniref:N2,N2-dimethylguanosine tRNA methyltransferase n=1 Tax=Acetobacter orientalis TaxID=146474 RepID=A0A2Z5ZLW8_9PROT|nr:N2,N2-dimethylguanosine tRNA methyltransferase [Acetobacter orientalis]